MKLKMCVLIGTFTLFSGCGGGSSSAGSSQTSSSPLGVGNSSVGVSSVGISSQPGSSTSSLAATPPVNQAPVANAGGDLEVYATQEVKIQGAGTDADGTIGSYKWEQLSGSPLNLANGVLTDKNLAFIAPDVAQDAVLEFKLTVVDNLSAAHSDQVRVNIKKLPVSGSVSGKVINIRNGAVVPGARVTIAGVESQTSNSGTFSFSDISLAEKRLRISVNKSGFVPQQKIIQFKDILKVEEIAVALVPIDTTLVIDPSEDNVISTSDEKVTLKLLQNRLVRSDNSPVIGPVTVSLTYIDPAVARNSMPGDYLARVNESDTTLLESFGAFDFRALDVVGEPLKLISPVEFQIIPATNFTNTVPPTSPTYLFDESTGLWIRQQLDAFRTLPFPSAPFNGLIGSIGILNIDKPVGTAQITGCVIDELGKPIANAIVKAESQAQINSSEVLTDVNGRWSLLASNPSQVVVSAEIGVRRTQKITLLTNSSSLAIPECLSLVNPKAIVFLSWAKKPTTIIPLLTITSAAHGVFKAPDLGVETWTALPFVRAEQYDSFGNLPTELSIRSFIDGEYLFTTIIAGGTEPDRTPVNQILPYVIVTIDGVEHRIDAPGVSFTDGAFWEVFKIVVKDGSHSFIPVNKFTNVAP